MDSRHSLFQDRGLNMGTSVEDFFDKVSREYDDSIRRIVPPYQEIFEAVVGYAFLDTQAPLRILELGCGTGNLSLFVAGLFPQAHLTLVDLSGEMLSQTALKLQDQAHRVALLEGGFIDVALPENAYDLVVSSMALHHLLDSEKPGMYQRIFRALKTGGLLRVADHIQTLPAAESGEKNKARWLSWAKESGASEEELVFWVEHSEKYDHYASLFDHFQWLARAGFIDIDTYWKKLDWSVFGAKKPAEP
jgi:tRNA (cmo5U34)-methyltransferase